MGIHVRFGRRLPFRLVSDHFLESKSTVGLGLIRVSFAADYVCCVRDSAFTVSLVVFFTRLLTAYRKQHAGTFASIWED